MGVYLVVCGIGGVVFAGEDMERASSCGRDKGSAATVKQSGEARGSAA